MALRCSTLTIFWAARLWLCGALSACLVIACATVARGQTRASLAQVQAGRETDVVLPLGDEVPWFGPPVAAVTLDVFLPFGHRATGAELARYFSLLEEHEDLRLRVHPVLGSDVAERGAELLLSAFQLAGQGAAHFLITVAEHPDWLTDWPAFRGSPEASAQLGSDRRRDGDLSLFAAAREQGIDVVQLRLQLTSRRQKETALLLWQRIRSSVRTPPEVWINGRRLRSPISDSALREELERQRRRAYQLVRSGTPLRALYDELVKTADTSEPTPAASPSSTSRWAAGRLLSLRSSVPAALPVPARAALQPTGFDLTDMPLRGPRVSPVTLVLVGSLESGPVCELAREVRDTLRPFGEAVRFAYLPAPNGPLFSPLSSVSAGSTPFSYAERTSRVPLILTALAVDHSPAFFRTYDAIIDLMRRRFMLSYVEFSQSILNQRVDFDRLEENSRSERMRAHLAQAQRDARALGATSLPALFINNRLVSLTGGPGGLGSGSVAVRSEQLSRLIEAELRRGALEKLRNRRRPSP